LVLFLFIYYYNIFDKKALILPAMTNQKSSNGVYDTTIRLFFMLLIIAWCLAILYPFISIMLWGLILALAFKPLQDSLVKWMGGKAKLASFIIVLVSLVVIVVPSWFFLDSIFENVKELKASYNEGNLTIPLPPEKVQSWPVIGDDLYNAWHSASVNLKEFIVKHKDQLQGAGSKLAKGLLSTAGGIFQMILSIIIAGILLVVSGAGESIRKFFRKLAGDRGDEFADMTVKTVGNVVKGILGVALIQALLIGLGFLLAGVPFAGVITLIVFLLAVLQLPPIIIVLPVIVYLFGEKETMPAILWSVYLILAGLSDNILKPVLLGKGAPVPMLVIFLGVIGGFIFSGFIGLFTGAIIMSIGYKLFVAWINTSSDEQQSTR
jgi:predicted PurR-regulated permease PerM